MMMSLERVAVYSKLVGCEDGHDVALTYGYLSRRFMTQDVKVEG